MPCPRSMERCHTSLPLRDPGAGDLRFHLQWRPPPVPASLAFCTGAWISVRLFFWQAERWSLRWTTGWWHKCTQIHQAYTMQNCWSRPNQTDFRVDEKLIEERLFKSPHRCLQKRTAFVISIPINLCFMHGRDFKKHSMSLLWIKKIYTEMIIRMNYKLQSNPFLETSSPAINLCTGDWIRVSKQ